MREGDRADTIPGVLTIDQPVLTGSRVLGFQYDEDGFIVAAFDYDLRQRRLRTLPLPTDFNAYFSAPSFSPDGSHLAYVIVPKDGTGWGAVVSWPERQLVWRTERVQVPATDARIASTRWISPDTAEILISVGDYMGYGMYRVTGSVRERRVLLADTVASPSRTH